MSLYIFIILSFVIHFGTPGENKNSITNNSPQDRTIAGFPYQYFEGEVLTDEMVADRSKLIYMATLMSIIATSSVGLKVDPIVEETRFPSTAASIERPIPKQSDFQIKPLQLPRYARGGAKSDPNRVLTQWLGKVDTNASRGFLRNINRRSPGMRGAVLSRAKPVTSSTDTSGVSGRRNPIAFMQRQMRLVLGVAFGMQPPEAPEAAEIPQETPPPTPGPVSETKINLKLKENVPLTLTVKKGETPPYLDDLGRTLFGSEYTNGEAERIPPSVAAKKFDTNDYDLDRFIKLAANPKDDQVIYGTFREARVLVQFEQQHELAKLVHNATRPDKIFAEKVDIDFIAAERIGVEIKQLMGKYGLLNQNQTIPPTLSWYKSGQRAMIQRQRFLDAEISPKNTSKILNQIINVLDLGYLEDENKPMAKAFFLEGVKSQNVTDLLLAFLNDNIDNIQNDNTEL